MKRKESYNANMIYFDAKNKMKEDIGFDIDEKDLEKAAQNFQNWCNKNHCEPITIEFTKVITYSYKN